MIHDLSPDVKEFLLSYSLVNQMTGLAQAELLKIYTIIEAGIAEQEWFSSIDFQTQKSWKWIQVWKKDWHPSHTQMAPWIHFEYMLSWADQWVQSSVDIETLKQASAKAVQDVADLMRQILSSEKPTLLKNQGWLLNSPLEGNRMLLVKRQNINKTEFSADWIYRIGMESFNQLSQIIPFVDRTLKNLFTL